MPLHQPAPGLRQRPASAVYKHQRRVRAHRPLSAAAATFVLLLLSPASHLSSAPAPHPALSLVALRSLSKRTCRSVLRGQGFTHRNDYRPRDLCKRCADSKQ